MTKVKTLILIIIAGVFINADITCTVGSGTPNYYDDLNVPVYTQIYQNYCGIACIQMWAHFDGWPTVTQDQIATRIGTIPNGCEGTDPYDLEVGVGAFTGSFGWLESRMLYEPGVQGDMISSSIEGVSQGFPSILPIYGCSHAILMRGFEWTEDSTGKPFAIRAIFNDPATGRRMDISADQLRQLYDPDPSTLHYWVLLAWEDFVWIGEFGHDTFVMMGGTYYGGPSYYNPKDLDLNPPTID